MIRIFCLLCLSFLSAGLAIAQGGDTHAAGAHTVLVKVSDADGAPVEGAAVEVIADHRPLVSATTTATGRVRLSIPDGPNVQWIVALKPGFGIDYFENYQVAPLPALGSADLPEEVDLRLAGARTVRIAAVDTEGKPVAGVRFVPWRLAIPDKKWFVNLSGSGIAAVATDADGNAVFDWLPPAPRQPADLGATFLVAGDDFCWPDPPEQILGEQGDRSVTARLLRNVTLTGSVFLPQGRPAAGVVVQAEGRGDTFHFCRETTRTAADGSFALRVHPNQSYTVCAFDDRMVAQAAGVMVVSGRNATPMVLELAPGTLLHGRMADANGKPVVGELVLLAHEDSELPEELRPLDTSGKPVPWALVRQTFTDADGRFAFRVPSGTYWYGAVAGDPSAVHRPRPLVVAGEASIEVAIRQSGDGRVWGFTAAPIRANRTHPVDHAMTGAPRASRSESCILCHRM